MKRVLVLGAGLVARPLVRYLLDKDHKVTVASRTVSKAGAMIGGHAQGTALALDLQDEQRLSGQIQEHDLTVSLVPFAFHPVVAGHCIHHKKHMVTTSYVSEAMQKLDPQARSAGVTVLNEIGVDPGIDHMSAMRIIHGVRQRGGRIVSFKSYCGGLPAPEDNDNPFGYKFSWAPRGVLLAGTNGAHYLWDGREVKIPPHRLFRDMHVLAIEGHGDYEAYPNRDSISYIDVYGLQGIHTMFRGTLRNMGWCDCLYNYAKLGLLGLEEMVVQGRSYAGFMRGLLGCGPSDDLAAATAGKLQIPQRSLPILNLEWLGMFSDRKFTVDQITPLDALGSCMFEKLAYKPDEKDMIVLFHDFVAEFDGGKKERITSRLIDYGIAGGDSSMARTVSLPAAIAVDRILSGRLTQTGVLRPLAADIYEPILDELATMNINCQESTEEY